MTREKKVNLLAVAFLLVLSLSVFLLLYLRNPVSSNSDSTADAILENTVIISVAGEEKMRIPLSRPQTVTISRPTGEENVISVTENGVRMEHSTCKNQICVHSGLLTPDNADYRSDGPFIICLPNQVSIELVVVQP